MIMTTSSFIYNYCKQERR